MQRRFYKDKEENEVKYHINFKLQANRYVGPYRIIAKISPVIYTTLIFIMVKTPIFISYI